MADLYHDGNRHWQDRFDTRRLADRIKQRMMNKDTIDYNASGFIQRMDMFFLASADEHGKPQCYYKGGDPGFVRVVDERTIAFPVYDGNGMFLSLGNIRAHANVGMLFIDFEEPNRVRVNGVAPVDEHDPLLATMTGAKLVVRVQTLKVFPNCSRYIHKLQLVERSKFVPHADTDPPIPDW